jgi:hypothetical protein
MKSEMQLYFVIITCLGGKKMKVHIFHPILQMDPWMDENLVVFATTHNCFGN